MYVYLYLKRVIKSLHMIIDLNFIFVHAEGKGKGLCVAYPFPDKHAQEKRGEWAAAGKENIRRNLHPVP